jgi:hypothetical protein
MQTSEIQAHIHFKHSPEEVAALNKAVIPMREFILAVSNQADRQRLRHVLGCEYFRSASAASVVTTLINASKHAKVHLGDFFPLMRAQILDDALALEEAALDYKHRFAELKNITIPTH